MAIQVELRPGNRHLERMVWNLIRFFGVSLASLAPAAVTADDISPLSLFQEAARAQPQYALGVSYALGRDDPTVMTSGPTVRRGSDPVADTAPWHIGSISKSFTATMVMRLVERGELQLDTPVGQYLASDAGGMHPDWSGVTLRQLLSHTAGLPANAPRKIIRDTYTLPPEVGRHRVLSTMWGAPLAGTSGEYVYSNLGYVLAGHVLETVTGEPWETLVQSEIGQPLGLSSLGFGAPTQADAARGHKSLLGLRRPVEPDGPASDNPAWMGPAGTLHLSLADLVAWGQLHLEACAGERADYLSVTSCQAMQTPVSSEYGLGWVVQRSGAGQPMIWHNGSNTMWYAILILSPEDELVVAVATNVYTADRIDALARRLVSVLTARTE
ncbi:serine hydrolase domain-containing protein [Roseobacter sinensis]|uniref:serine hydrolase domain-containing protein n=1 Tax=Roseobacter sinensis TaxID=2931391 RepID=UPI0021E8CEE4|nr:serine hydrolase domain-containing protein [Roseobacter sp. WL0113]